MTPPPRDTPNGPAVGLAQLLRDAADRLDQEPADAPDETIRQVVLLLVTLIGRLEAELLRWMGVFDAKTVWVGDGSRTPGSWLGARSELSAKRAGGMFADARTLASCPLVEAAGRSGVLGTAKVRMLIGAFETYPDLFTAQEQWLVDQLAGLTVAHAKVFMARWLAAAEATKDAEARERGEDPEHPTGHRRSRPRILRRRTRCSCPGPSMAATSATSTWTRCRVPKWRGRSLRRSMGGSTTAATSTATA